MESPFLWHCDAPQYRYSKHCMPQAKAYENRFVDSFHVMIALSATKAAPEGAFIIIPDLLPTDVSIGRLFQGAPRRAAAGTVVGMML